jgi:hypothetical protein
MRRLASVLRIWRIQGQDLLAVCTAVAGFLAHAPRRTESGETAR